MYALVSLFQTAVGIYLTLWCGFERRFIETDYQPRAGTDDATATAVARQRLWYWYRPAASAPASEAISPPVVVLHGIAAVSPPHLSLRV